MNNPLPKPMCGKFLAESSVVKVQALQERPGLTLLLALLAADVPFAFVAVTVKVYEVSLVNPETVIGLDAPVPVSEPGELVTVYEVIGNLLNEGAVNVTDALALPAVAVPIVGAVAGPFVEPCAPRIGIRVSYHT